MSSPTIHTVGLRGIVAPWAVGFAGNESTAFLSSRPAVKVQAGPGAEAWAEDFIRDRAPRAILPGSNDWLRPGPSHDFVTE